MSHKLYDVIGIGNAIVDILAKVEDAFLEKHGLVKGSMTLIDQAVARRMYDDMPPSLQVSGGSVANSMAGIASLGGRAAFIGKVSQDSVGALFRQDIEGIGVEYTTPPSRGDEETARSFVAITPDAQRTMATYLGAARYLETTDIDSSLIEKSRILYLEGYLWDEPSAKTAMRHAIKIARKSETKIAFALSDIFCVERHRAEFLSLIAQEVDILFGNELEMKALYESEDMGEVIRQLKKYNKIAVLTLGEKGSVIVADALYEIAPHVPEAVVDTTGSGDLYASGFLYGYVGGMSLPRCGALASLTAAEVISHVGARPQMSLSILAHREGLLEQAA